MEPLDRPSIALDMSRLHSKRYALVPGASPHALALATCKTRKHSAEWHGVPAAPVEAEIIVDGDADRHTSTADLLRFTLPTLGIWLIGPILSLVDTAFVGAQVRLCSESLSYAASNAEHLAHRPQPPRLWTLLMLALCILL